MKKTATTARTSKPATKTFSCACPYCDEEVTSNKTPLFCVPCKTVLRYCKTCRKAASRDSRVCPDCGGELN